MNGPIKKKIKQNLIDFLKMRSIIWNYWGMDRL